MAARHGACVVLAARNENDLRPADEGRVPGGRYSDVLREDGAPEHVVVPVHRIDPVQHWNAQPLSLGEPPNCRRQVQPLTWRERHAGNVE